MAILIGQSKGVYRWDKDTLSLFLLSQSDNSEIPIICDKCNEDKFVIEGLLKRCCKCNALYI